MEAFTAEWTFQLALNATPFVLVGVAAGASNDSKCCIYLVVGDADSGI